MTVIQTNAALGYREYATFIKIPNEENKFLCIFTNEDNGWDNCYTPGEIEEFDYPSEYDVIPEHKYDLVLSESPLKGSYLYEEFLNIVKDKK